MTSNLLLQCLNCKESFGLVEKFPVLLDCGDAICVVCYDKKALNQKQTHCVECFQLSEVQNRVRKDLFRIGLLHEASTELKTTPKKPSITNCCVKCKIVAWKSCSLCKFTFCDSCFSKSHDDEIWNQHKLVDKSSPVAGDSEQLINDQFCFLHEDRKTFYCLSCVSRICLICNSGHKDHNLTTIEIQNETKKSSFLAFSDALESTLDKSCRVLKDLNHFEEDFVAFGTEASNSIDQTISKLISTLQLVGIQRKEELKVVCNEYQDKIDEVQTLVCAEIELIRKEIRCVKKVIELRPKFIVLENIVHQTEASLVESKIIVELVRQPRLNPFKFDFIMQSDLKNSAKLCINMAMLEPGFVYFDINHIREIESGKVQTTDVVICETVERKRSSSSESSHFSDSSTEQKRTPSDSKSDSIKSLAKIKIPNLANKSSQNDSPKLKPYNEKKNRLVLKQRMIQFKFFEGKIIGLNSLQKFYVCQSDPKSLAESEKFMTEMQNFYQKEYNQKHIRPIYNPFKGFVAAVLFHGFWRRSIIQEVLREEAKVFLPDVGKFEIVKLVDIKPLMKQFWQHEQEAIECCLADVEPKNGYGYDFSPKALKEFKKLAVDSNFTTKILVSRSSVEGAPTPVVVFVYPNNGKKINLNAMLVERMNCAESKGVDSTEMITEDDRELQMVKVKTTKNLFPEKKTRFDVEILDIVDPGEFYGLFIDRREEILELHQDIHREATIISTFQSLKDAGDPIKWSSGDGCFVSYAIDPKKEAEWFRGEVLSVTDDDLEVFLMDKGLKIRVEPKAAIPLSKHLYEQPPGAIKMHFPYLIPTGGSKSWTRSSIEIFQQTISQYTSQCISIVGNKNASGSNPVLLWGVSYENLGLITQKKFHNIWEYLVNEGYVDNNSNMSPEDLIALERPFTNKDFAWKSASFNPRSLPGDFDGEQNDSCVLEQPKAEELVAVGDFNMSLTLAVINSWLPAEDTNAGEFVGVPSNVDKDGLIYIHSEQQKLIVEAMKENLTAFYSKQEPEESSMSIKLGQPVIVQNPFDAKFYRGIIEAMQKNGKGFKVFLVDYGTSEFITRQDIFTQVVAANIPIQTKKYLLAEVIPREGNNWSGSTLNYIHASIVDIKCQVEIKGDLSGVKKCSINLMNRTSQQEPIKFEWLLVEARRAKWGDAVQIWLAKLQASMAENRFAYQETMIDVFDREEHERIIEEVEIQKLDVLTETLTKSEAVTVSLQETKEYLRTQAEDLDEDSSRSVISLKYCSYSQFNESVQDTSTQYGELENIFEQTPKRKHRGIRTLRKIRFYDLLAAEITEFNCKVVDVFNDKVHVLPDIPELTTNTQQLENALKAVDENLLIKFSNLERSTTRLCLVKIHDNWQRGRIINVSHDSTVVYVFMIDFARVEAIKPDEIFKLPMKLAYFPKAILAVLLNGVVANTKQGSSEDAFKLLKTTLQGQSLKVTVKRYDAKGYPIVDIEDGTGKLAYQDLIDKNFFVTSVHS